MIIVDGVAGQDAAAGAGYGAPAPRPDHPLLPVLQCSRTRPSLLYQHKTTHIQGTLCPALPCPSCSGSGAAEAGAAPPVVGFCFSFPSAQTALDKGVLVDWTKGFTCTGVWQGARIMLWRLCLGVQVSRRVGRERRGKARTGPGASRAQVCRQGFKVTEGWRNLEDN